MNFLPHLSPYIGTIVQEVTLTVGRFRSISKRSFENAAQFETTKIEFIEAISEVYGHSKLLIDAKLKDGTNDVVILTFYIQTNSQKDSLLAAMKDCILSGDACNLIGNLNIKIKSVPTLASQTVTGLADPVYSDGSGKSQIHPYFG